MNSWFVLFFSMLIHTLVFSQSEKVVDSPVSLMEILRKEQAINFSFVEDVVWLKSQSTIVKLPMSSKDITTTFNRLGCDVKFLDDKHILIRTSNITKVNSDADKDQLRTIIIKDEKSGKPIEWASAYKQNLSGGSLFSDGRGKVIIGDAESDIIISQLGYEKVMISKDVLKSKNYHVINLKTVPFEIDAVTKYETIIPFQKESDFERIKNTLNTSLTNKGVGGRDVFAVVQNLPGVDATSESGGQIKVRGSKTEETLILLDKVPLINAGHYFEMFSAVNPLYVEKIGFYKNTLPIEYTGAAAALLTLDGTNQIPDKVKGELDLNLLTVAASVSIPISNKIAVIGALRKSISNISNNKFYSLSTRNNQANTQNIGNSDMRENIFNSNPSFGFHDANFKALYANNRTKASISYFKINDDFENNTEFQLKNRFPNVPNNVPNFANSFVNTRTWTSNGLGLDFQQEISRKWKIDFNAYRSSYGSDYLLRSEIASNAGILKSLTNTALQSEVNMIGSRVTSKLQISEVLDLTNGYSLDHINNVNVLEDNKGNMINIQPSGFVNTIYNEIRYAHKKVGASIGMRNIYNTNLASWYTSPQLSIDFALSDELTLKTSMARNFQFHRKIELRELYDQSLGFWTMSGGNLPVLRNDTYMVGANFKKDGLMFDVEFYKKNMNGVAEYINPNPSLKIDETAIERLELFTGRGKNIGLDLMARYDGRSITTQMSYTLSKLTYEIEGIFQGNEYAAPNDRRHQLKFLNSIKVKRFMVNYNVNFATGTPYVIASRIPDNTMFRNIVQTSVLNRLPSYLRNDIGLVYQFKKGNTRHNLSFEVFNLFNRMNVKQVQYLSIVKDKNAKSESIIVGTNTNMLNRTLSLGYGVKF